jgi:hypothetical protein
MSRQKLKNDFPVSHTVLELKKFKDLPIPAKWLYCSLCKLSNRLADEDGWFFRTYAALEVDTGLSRPTISRATRALEISDLIETMLLSVKIKNGKFRRDAKSFRLCKVSDSPKSRL